MIDVNVYLSLCFIVNNSHCYPILNDELKKQITQKHRIDLKDFMYNITYDDCKYISSKDNLNISKLMKQTDKKVILLEINDLCYLASYLMGGMGKFIYNTNFYEIGCYFSFVFLFSLYFLYFAFNFVFHLYFQSFLPDTGNFFYSFWDMSSHFCISC